MRLDLMNNSRPRVLAILPGFIPSTIILVVKPFQKMHRAGRITAKISLESLVTSRDIKWADLVVFCRNTDPEYSSVLNALLNQNIPFIYELDDNFFELPQDSEIGRYHRSPERLAMLTNYIKMADLVRVYSKPLLDKSNSLNSKTEQVVGPIDLNLIVPHHSTLDSKTIKLVYGTSRTQDELSDLFTPALTRILNKYAGGIEAHFWGSVPSELQGFPGVFYHRLIRNYDRFLRRFSQVGFDIGLAPLPDDVFHRSKTNNKFREYGACRIAGVYSDVEVYSSCVVDGETGLLVRNDPEAWYQAMVRLIEDHELREKIKNQARQKVQQQYSQEIFEKVWWKQIQQVLEEKIVPSVASRKPVEISRELPSLDLKFWNLISHYWKNGFYSIFNIFQRRFFNLWMVMKLRFYFHTISAFIIITGKISGTKSLKAKEIEIEKRATKQ
jgi:hypothetical protein